MGSLPIPESLKRRATGALIILGALGWLAAAWYGRCTHADSPACCSAGICALEGHHVSAGARQPVLALAVQGNAVESVPARVSESGSATTQRSALLQDLWQHVYNPNRLRIVQARASVTGVIVDATHGKRKSGVRKEADGDCHGWLKLDPGQEKYLNEGNFSDEGGNLVYEVVCLFPVTQSDAKAYCKNYKSPIHLAPVGSHVRMTGSWVQDSNHARWMELHPVSSIELMPKDTP